MTNQQVKTNISPTMGVLDWVMVVTLSVLWGGSFFFQGIAVKELPPLTIVACRVCLAALTLFLVMRVMGLKIPLRREVLLAFVGMGILNNVIPFILIVWGQSHIASGLASILNAMTPIFTVIVAHFLTNDEKLTGAKLVGIAFGFLGVAVMIGPDILSSFGVNVTAQLAILGATISYGFSGVFGRRFKKLEVPPMATATGQVTASSLILVPLALVVDQPWTLTTPSAVTLLSVLALAVLSTSLAYILFFRIIASAGATNVSLVTFLIPPSAIFLGVVVLGETLLLKHFIGLGLIVFGLIILDGRLLRRQS